VPKLETQSDSPSPPARPILIGPRIWDELDSYDKNLKAKFVRTFRWISRDIAHPSLRLELVKAGKDSFYRVRVDPQYRIHFELVGEYYLILAVGPHHLQGIG
jgi:plasmid maintenance system killer protein